MHKSIGELNEVLARVFQRYVTKLESIPDEPELVGVGVYGVEKEKVSYVSGMICKISDKFFPVSGVELIPLVRSEGITDRYYPEFSRVWNWHKNLTKHVCPSGMIIMEASYLEKRASSVYQTKYKKVEQQPIDEQMALAA